MSYRFLLDTDIVSDLIRNPGGRITARIERVGQDRVCTSVISAGELRFGALRKASPPLSAQMETVLESLDILPFEAPADLHYAEVRLSLQRAGQVIGPNDLLIAAHALALGLTLVTGNVREFSRVPGLQIENWLR